MRKLLLLAAAVPALSISGTANAASCVDNLGTEECLIQPGEDEFTVSGDIFNGPVSATIGRSGIAAGNFIDTYRFEIPQFGTGSGSISTSASLGLGSITDLDIISVTVNGLLADLTKTSGGVFEFAGISGVPIVPGVDNFLVITGFSRGQGSYGGNATFQPTAPVPEPATWAMMLIGFGAIGFAMRRRREDRTRVRYAF